MSEIQIRAQLISWYESSICLNEKKREIYMKYDEVLHVEVIFRVEEHPQLKLIIFISYSDSNGTILHMSNYT